MNEIGPVLGILVIGAFIALIIIAAQRAAKRHQEQLALFISHYGFVMVPKSEPAGCATFGTATGAAYGPQLIDVFEHLGFSPFGTGDSRRVNDVLIRRAGDRVEYLFQYQYTTGSGDDKTTHNYDIVAFQLPLAMPRFNIRPQHFLDNFVGFFGARDIQFESEEFNARLHVTATDARYAFDLMHPKAMEFAMANVTQHWQLCGDLLVFELPSGQMFDEYPRLVWLVDQFLDLMPGYVQEQYAKPGVTAYAGLDFFLPMGAK